MDRGRSRFRKALKKRGSKCRYIEWISQTVRSMTDGQIIESIFLKIEGLLVFKRHKIEKQNRYQGENYGWIWLMMIPRAMPQNLAFAP